MTSADNTSGKGIFITFEGDDGVGKSTHINFLAKTLRELGYEVVNLREPGGTSIGEQLRAIVLDPNNQEITPETELLIYEAARAQLVSQVIKPALGRGAVVLCDRFIDSTVAYQGFGRGLDVGFIEKANGFATYGIIPDKTILMTCSKRGDKAKRVRRRDNADRFDNADAAFHDAVSSGYKRAAQRHPDRIDVVDTSGKHSDTARSLFDSLGLIFPELVDGSVDFKETFERFDREHEH